MIVFISKDNLQCSGSLRLTRGTKAVMTNKIL